MSSFIVADLEAGWESAGPARDTPLERGNLCHGLRLDFESDDPLQSSIPDAS